MRMLFHRVFCGPTRGSAISTRVSVFFGIGEHIWHRMFLPFSLVAAMSYMKRSCKILFVFMMTIMEKSTIYRIDSIKNKRCFYI